MTEAVSDLIEAAGAVLQNSYSPYSGFRVGAALRSDSGRIYRGTNVENASLGLSICAERAAVFQAVAAGETGFSAIAICADSSEVIPPCGACRQVLMEFAPEIEVILTGSGGKVKRYRLAELLAHPFADFRPRQSRKPKK